MATDTDPNGWIYVGGTTALYRVPKGGGPSEAVHTVAGLTGDQLGYAMLVNGSDIFTVESQTTGMTEHLWRISTDGGATWNAEDYAVPFGCPRRRAGVDHRQRRQPASGDGRRLERGLEDDKMGSPRWRARFFRAPFDRSEVKDGSALPGTSCAEISRRRTRPEA
jgi:hypothetical protein